MDDTFNMSMRKFLKQVGVTSQQAIEEAVRNAGSAANGKPIALTMTLSSPDIGLSHVVTGTIEGPTSQGASE